MDEASLRAFLIVLVALAVFVLLRVALITGAPTQLHHPEEIVNLRLAAAVLGEDGAWPVELAAVPEPPPESIPPETSFFDYQFQDFDGGTLVVSVLLVPIAGVFGLTQTTVKIGAVLWALAIALAWLALLGRLLGTAGTLAATAAFVCLPVPAFLLSCIHWGNHFESALFPPLILLLLVEAGRAEELPRRLGLAAGAGLLAGFGTWFSLLNLLPAVLAAGALVALMGRGALLGLPAYGAAAAVGFSPWLGRNELGGSVEAQGRSVPDLLTGLFAGEGQSQGPRSVLELWPRFAEWSLPELWVPSESTASLLSFVSRSGVVVGALALSAAVIVSARRGQTQRARELGALLGVCAASYVLVVLMLDTSHELKDRRMAPVYVYGWMLFAAGTAAWADRAGPARLIAGVVAAGILLPSLSAEVRLVLDRDLPAEPLQVWTHFAVPADAPRFRTEAGISQVASGEVPLINAAVAELLTNSSTRGTDELRGLARALVVHGDEHNSGALRRAKPTCPSEELLERASLSLIMGTAEANAFGRGLGLRCDGAATALRCDLLQSDELTEACVRGGAQH